MVALANQAQSNGNPVYGIKDVPPTSSKGLPKITQPNVYFASGDTGYVVADTKQLEVDYQTSNGNNVESHYTGKTPPAVCRSPRCSSGPPSPCAWATSTC